MKKITSEAVKNFLNSTNFRKDNTKVEVLENVTILKLYDNSIAYKYNDPKETLSITMAGWITNTTKERLNGIPGVNLSTKKGILYLNGSAWDGKIIDVK
jgi:hypothetical protein